MKISIAYLNSFILLIIQLSYPSLVFAKLNIPSTCSNGVTPNDFERVQEILKGEDELTIQDEIYKICNDSSLNLNNFRNFINDPVTLPGPPPTTQSLPDSLRRRLILNNTPGTYTNPSILVSIVMTGNIPPGVNIYFPQEEKAINAVGGNTNVFPPNMAGSQNYANNQIAGAVDNTPAAAIGHASAIVPLLLLGTFGTAALFWGCPTAPSSYIFLAASIMWMIGFVKTLIDFLKKRKKIKELLSNTDEIGKEVDWIIGEFDKMSSSNYIGGYGSTANQKGAYSQCMADTVGEGLLDQYSFFKLATEDMEFFSKMTTEWSYYLIPIAAAYNTALGFAIYEAYQTAGAGCVTPGAGKNKLIPDFILPTAYAQQGNAGGQITEKFKKLEGYLVFFHWMLGVAPAGFALFSMLKGGAQISVLRILIMGSAALHATTALISLQKSQKYFAKLAKDMRTVLTGLERNLRNERVNLDKSNWLKREEKLNQNKLKYWPKYAEYQNLDLDNLDENGEALVKEKKEFLKKSSDEICQEYADSLP